MERERGRKKDIEGEWEKKNEGERNREAVRSRTASFNYLSVLENCPSII